MAAKRSEKATAFSGWSVVAAAFAVLFVVYGIQFSFGVFVDDIAEDTGWSENRVQLVFALYILGYSALSAVSGFLTDRFGPRRVVGIGGVVLTAGYLVWAGAPNLWIVLLGLGIIAPIGMSASWVPCNATIVRWFIRRRGLALAAQPQAPLARLAPRGRGRLDRCPASAQLGTLPVHVAYMYSQY